MFQCKNELGRKEEKNTWKGGNLPFLFISSEMLIQPHDICKFLTRDSVTVNKLA